MNSDEPMTDRIPTCAEVDEGLAPYVDGQATPELRRGIDAHLALCPPCRQHADAEAAARTIVHGHRDELRPHATDALRERCERLRQDNSRRASAGMRSASRPIVRRWVPLSLAATVVLAVAGVFLLGLNNRVEALTASLAVDHVKCFKAYSTAGSIDSAEAAVRWQQDQGWSVTVPSTEPSEQLRLVKVRRCFTTDGRSAHMMYMWHGAPLSLYVLPEDAGAARDEIIDRFGCEAVVWCSQGRTYAVVADGHPQDLPHIVEYLKTRVK